ncbi:serine hydrolase [Phytomonospora endophytica]|uniref:Beta-lactamase class A n=1 Tax=Phytomonospora endophytica TaxID=714109 RepID=A0A841FTB6_9ACTN|nr:serine hydrolase [Phytomonospora endophytica]MBB6038043.1 beta-lactamase class A [Phytomonospora endophytica]GIG67493.1 serine hydrolase [Phytomonospora endophytica]
MPLQDVFAEVGADAALHAVDLATGAGTGLTPDRPVVIASVLKVLIALEFARQADAGQLDPADRVRVREDDRLGGTGTAGCLDDVELSLRDLAAFMMSVSDNTAADLLCDRVGVPNLRSLVTELGMDATVVTGPPRTVVTAMAEDLGDLAALAAASDEELAGTRAYRPGGTNTSTPRDMTRMLAAIWGDTAGTPAACAHVRTLMSRQADWHRIAAGFDDDVRVAAKSGTLPGLRNEVAVAEYPDGSRYAIAVFTRIATPHRRRPDVDLAIGRAARIAVDELRGA